MHIRRQRCVAEKEVGERVEKVDSGDEGGGVICIAEQVRRLGGEIKTVRVDEERSERGTGSGPTPGVDFN